GAKLGIAVCARTAHQNRRGSGGKRRRSAREQPGPERAGLHRHGTGSHAPPPSAQETTPATSWGRSSRRLWPAPVTIVISARGRREKGQRLPAIDELLDAAVFQDPAPALVGQPALCSLWLGRQPGLRRDERRASEEGRMPSKKAYREAPAERVADHVPRFAPG